MQETNSANPLPSSPPESRRALARQSILDDNGIVVGYELFDRALPSAGHTATTDAQLLFHALSLAENDPLASRKTIFLHCTYEGLTAGHLDLVAPERVVLQMTLPSAALPEQLHNRLPHLQHMQSRGFRMAFDSAILAPAYAAWLPLASYIQFDVSNLAPEALEAQVRQARAQGNARLMARHVETDAHFFLAQSAGISLFQGYWFAQPVLVQGQRLRPSQANILRLIDMVRRQSSTNEIEALLKHDPVISFNLLRLINSAGFGLRTEVTSFKHAVMLLGLNRLFKWAALLMTTSLAGDTAPAVGTTAVVRGRLMEMLTDGRLPPEEGDNAFVVGIFSLLDTMLAMPMEAALATLNLPTDVCDALLHKSGPLAPYLALTIACESNNDEAFGHATQQLGLSSGHVNWCHLQALVWAETVGA